MEKAPRVGNSSLIWLAALVLTVSLMGTCLVRHVCADGSSFFNPFEGPFDALYGNFDGDATRVLMGDLSFQKNEKYGAQIDGAGGEISQEGYWGTGLHLFRGKAKHNLTGLFTTYQELDKESLYRTGVEGEYFLRKWITLTPNLGYQYGDVKHGGSFEAGAKLYPLDSLAINAKPGVHAGDFLFSLGIEYLVGLNALPGLSLYGSGAMGEGNYESWFAGIRLRFGPEQSLREWDQTDGPDSLMLGGMPHLIQKARETDSDEAGNEAGCCDWWR